MLVLVRGSFLSCSQQHTPTSSPTLPSQASPTVSAARAQSPGPEQIPPRLSPTAGLSEDWSARETMA